MNYVLLLVLYLIYDLFRFFFKLGTPIRLLKSPRIECEFQNLTSNPWKFGLTFFKIPKLAIFLNKCKCVERFGVRMLIRHHKYLTVRSPRKILLTTCFFFSSAEIWKRELLHTTPCGNVSTNLGQKPANLGQKVKSGQKSTLMIFCTLTCFELDEAIRNTQCILA